MAQSLGEDVVQLQILQNLGNTYQTLREYKQAISCYETFLELSQGWPLGGEPITDVTRRVLTQLTLASIAIQDHSRAIVHLQHHLTIACALGDTRATATLIDSLKSSYAALNRSRMEALGLGTEG
ncbi:MAG: tetratricopeptide repeat-containing protein [Leptolyngbyaceae cyanobacterium SM2_3_12]|nr:tetratricopeptide repeat-containing protein [Leptolyngbyaceae cyanobacterium SM2_3_12]